jgi:hypothetical protein
MICSKCIFYVSSKHYPKCSKFNIFFEIARQHKCKGYLFFPKMDELLHQIKK